MVQWHHMVSDITDTTWTNADLLSIGPFWTNLSKISVEIHTIFFYGNVSENICKVAAILLQPECVNHHDLGSSELRNSAMLMIDRSFSANNIAFCFHLPVLVAFGLTLVLDFGSKKGQSLSHQTLSLCWFVKHYIHFLLSSIRPHLF